MPRSLDELRRDQDAILQDYRVEMAMPELAGTHSATATTFTGMAYGRVTAIVTENENLGPHVLVMRQTWTGTPPVPVDAGLAAQPAYPLPGHAVSEFEVGQFVRIEFLPGAALIHDAD